MSFNTNNNKNNSRSNNIYSQNGWIYNVCNAFRRSAYILIKLRYLLRIDLSVSQTFYVQYTAFAIASKRPLWNIKENLNKYTANVYFDRAAGATTRRQPLSAIRSRTITANVPSVHILVYLPYCDIDRSQSQPSWLMQPWQMAGACNDSDSFMSPHTASYLQSKPKVRA